MRFRTASVIVVVCALWTFNLSAQDAKSTNAPSVSPILSAHGTNTVNASDGASSLAELPVVTVTARKGAEPAQSTPVSVTAVNADTIEAEGVHTVKDAAIYAPNVNISEFTVRRLSSPFFRGIGASVNNPGITTFYDGVPQFNANSSSIELVDVNQVEFVRGPQSALFGRNTVGGLINFTSRRPALDAWRASVESAAACRGRCRSSSRIWRRTRASRPFCITANTTKFAFLIRSRPLRRSLTPTRPSF